MGWPRLADAINQQLPPGEACYPPFSIVLVRMVLDQEILVRPAGDPDAYLEALSPDEWRALVRLAVALWRFGDDPLIPALPDDLQRVRATPPTLGLLEEEGDEL
jgi:hypothetical protein